MIRSNIPVVTILLALGIAGHMTTLCAGETDDAAVPPQAITNSIGMRLVLVQPGRFMMGSPADEPGRRPDETRHEVELTDGFYLGATEVTQAQWKAIMETEPWSESESAPADDNAPATHVSWEDAIQFCRALSAKEGKRYRLPTEAEWEYACRAGTQTAYSFGDNPDELAQHAWYDANAAKADQPFAHPAAAKKPNPWGLYDMHGNVWEWCLDRYGEYPPDATQNPKGPASGQYRIMRGGAWSYGPAYCRSAYRGWRAPELRRDNFGFRVLMHMPEQ